MEVWSSWTDPPGTVTFVPSPARLTQRSPAPPSRTFGVPLNSRPSRARPQPARAVTETAVLAADPCVPCNSGAGPAAVVESTG
jgi:hypothetical protein